MGTVDLALMRGMLILWRTRYVCLAIISTWGYFIAKEEVRNGSSTWRELIMTSSLIAVTIMVGVLTIMWVRMG